MARDQDDIRLGLCHTGRNRANARRRHQLHGHLTARVDLLEVIDQLRKVFDGIDIVVRRRRDQGHPLGRMAQTGDQVGDLHARKLTTLAGLGPLGDLDFKLFTLVQVFGSHTETARRHLLDLGRRVITVGLGHEVRRIFATFARVGLGPDAVHRNVQGLVCLGRQRAKGHARRHETLADRGDGFDLFDRHWGPQRLDVQQVAQMDRRIALHLGAILLPHLVGRFVAGHLQHVHRRCFPCVGLAGFARLVEAADGHDDAITLPTTVVDRFGLALDTGHTDPADTAGHAGEVFRAHRTAQPYGFEVQAATVGGHDADAHLRHDFQQALINRLAVAGHRGRQVHVQQTTPDTIRQ